MSNRVSATISIGGEVKDLDGLIDAVENEGVGPDWNDYFSDRNAILEHLANGGVTFSDHEVIGGEFGTLQAELSKQGLTWRLIYDGYGGEWGPGVSLWTPEGGRKDYHLDGDGGSPCIGLRQIRGEGFTTVEEIEAYLKEPIAPLPALAIPDSLIEALVRAGA
jgi:hypothetical protein